MVNEGYGEEAGSVEVEVDVQEVPVELVEQHSTSPRDMGISQLFAQHSAVFGLHQAIIIAMSWSGFGEANQSFPGRIQQFCYHSVYKLRPVVRMEASDEESFQGRTASIPSRAGTR